ncbi:MAG: hypothetical protein H0Z38_08375 [Firmicutes bacterium]|nr:hypothetical protein [Bacillota bacterium]
MIQVAKDDVLKGLRKCKRLAKQALLASNLTDNPAYWNDQAVSRRETYDFLMKSIEEAGLEDTFQIASAEYIKLKKSDISNDPITAGRKQALEMFFTIIGKNSSSLVVTEQVENSPSAVVS